MYMILRLSAFCTLFIFLAIFTNQKAIAQENTNKEQVTISNKEYKLIKAKWDHIIRQIGDDWEKTYTQLKSLQDDYPELASSFKALIIYIKYFANQDGIQPNGTYSLPENLVNNTPNTLSEIEIVDNEDDTNVLYIGDIQLLFPLVTCDQLHEDLLDITSELGSNFSWGSFGDALDELLRIKEQLKELGCIDCSKMQNELDEINEEIDEINSIDFRDIFSLSELNELQEELEELEEKKEEIKDEMEFYDCSIND